MTSEEAYFQGLKEKKEKMSSCIPEASDWVAQTWGAAPCVEQQGGGPPHPRATRVSCGHAMQTKEINKDSQSV